MMPMTAAELARHSKLGGGELSAIRRSIEKGKIFRDSMFVWLFRVFNLAGAYLEFRRDADLDFLA